MPRYSGRTDNLSPYRTGAGIILVNIGTPEAPTTPAVWRYLYEFLSDPRIVELPRWIWKPVLFLLLLFRSPRSAALYRKVWTVDGSPLLVTTRSLASLLQQEIGGNYQVETAMRYGKPDLGKALRTLEENGFQNVIIIPLYPQYSGTTTGSVFDAVAKSLSVQRRVPRLTFVNEYHRDQYYVRAVADSVRFHWEMNGRAEKLLFSFHGIPRRFVRDGDPYASQCEKTAELVATELELDAGEWQLVYQSRFGREEWLTPYCNITLAGLPSRGVTSVDIVCPGFAADCLETLDEINRENRKIFLGAGGHGYSYIPCLNDSPAHVRLLSHIAGIEMPGNPAQ
jgi:ferrochelatase